MKRTGGSRQQPTCCDCQRLAYVTIRLMAADEKSASKSPGIKKFPSPRVLNVFANVEATAERLLAIVTEERRLRGRLEELWREKTCLVASLCR